MARNILTLLILTFSTVANPLFAQIDTINWYNGVKLTNSTFKIDQSLLPHLEINVHSEYKFRPHELGKAYPIVNSQAVLTISESNLPDSTTKSLEYAQFKFDLAGYQTKLIKYRAFTLGKLKGTSTEKKKMLDDIFFQTNQETSKLDNELFQSISEDHSELNFAKWRNKIANLLASIPEVTIEEQELGFRLGMYIGAGHHILTGTTKQHFSNPTAFNLGFNVDVKKSRYELDILFGGNKTTKQLTAKGDWPAGLKTSFTNAEITYGRKFHKNKWLLVPYVGFGINEFTPRKNDTEDKRSVAGYSPVLGFELNYYFGNQEDYIEHVFFFYRCKVSVNPSNFLKNYDGAQFNLKLAAGFDVARLKHRMAIRR